MLAWPECWGTLKTCLLVWEVCIPEPLIQFYSCSDQRLSPPHRLEAWGLAFCLAPGQVKRHNSHIPVWSLTSRPPVYDISLHAMLHRVEGGLSWVNGKLFSLCSSVHLYLLLCHSQALWYFTWSSKLLVKVFFYMDNWLNKCFCRVVIEEESYSAIFLCPISIFLFYLGKVVAYSRKRQNEHCNRSLNIVLISASQPFFKISAPANSTYPQLLSSPLYNEWLVHFIFTFCHMAQNVKKNKIHALTSRTFPHSEYMFLTLKQLSWF